MPIRPSRTNGVHAVITPEQVDQWSAEEEDERLEFKVAREQFDLHRLMEYLVALANEGGGRILLGVTDKPPRSVVGTAAFRDINRLKFRAEVEEVLHPNGRVLVLTAPPRLRGNAHELEGKYLMRVGDALVPMTSDRLRQIFAEGTPDWLEEPSRIGLSEEDIVGLLDTQAFFDLLGDPYPSNRAAVIERLATERLVVREGAALSIKRMGGLLFAKRLDHFPDLMRKRIRVTAFQGIGKLSPTKPHILDRGYASGFEELIQLVLTQLPRNEIIGKALRRDVQLVPDIVVRELIANAILHQDFGITGASVDVELYADRVEILNPGEPIVAPDRFIDGYLSRNERLGDLLRRMRICEKRGNGIDKVITAAEVYQLPAPVFRVDHRRTVAIVFGPRLFDDMERSDRVRACYQHCALRFVMRQPMTNRSLRERFKLREDRSSLVSQVINATEEDGLIKRDPSPGNSRKLARYLPYWA